MTRRKRVIASRYYAAHYAQFNPLLKPVGLVTIFLFWCYLTALIVLLGAQINAELERHTDEDTPEVSLGRRRHPRCGIEEKFGVAPAN